MPQFGRKSPKNAPALPFGAIRARGAAVPPHPGQVDYLAALSDWKMLGNGPDPENVANGVPAAGAGDCVSVTQANDRHAVCHTLTGDPTYWTLAQVVKFYRTQNPSFPSQDDGMDMQTALEYLHKNGGPDGVKCVAFAKVDHTNPDEVAAAIATFGGVQVGVNVQGGNMDDFDAGRPWDYHRGQPYEGGHAVYGGGYLDEAGQVRFITWAEETLFTDSFWAHSVEECWIVIWPEHLGTAAFEAGVDREALAAAYQALTGATLPLPPTPGPTPPPAPAGGGASFPGSTAQVDLHVARSAARAGLSVSDWLNRHFGAYFNLAP